MDIHCPPNYDCTIRIHDAPIDPIPWLVLIGAMWLIVIIGIVFYNLVEAWKYKK